MRPCPRFLLAALVLLAPAAAGASGPRNAPPAHSEAGSLCAPAIAMAERAESIPGGLLHSIGVVESGRADPASGSIVPWPWTINAEGQGRYFETREAAIATTRALLAAGVRSIDVGCAQVNLLHHPAAFSSLEVAFDPVANAAYAARFLRGLNLAAGGNWPVAAAAYHSQTPERGHAYAARIAAVWPDAARHGPWPLAPADLVLAAPGGVAVAPARPDYSRYTPAFAARVRWMDEDRTRHATPQPVRTTSAAPQPIRAASTAPRLPAAPVVMLPDPAPLRGSAIARSGPLPSRATPMPAPQQRAAQVPAPQQRAARPDPAATADRPVTLASRRGT